MQAFDQHEKPSGFDVIFEATHIFQGPFANDKAVFAPRIGTFTIGASLEAEKSR